MIEEIISSRRRDVEDRKREISLEDLPDRSTKFNSLFNSILGRFGEAKIIAEIKPMSPSEGVIKSDLDVVEIAKDYEAGGAVGISVLTEERYFGGRIEYLKEVKDNVNIPVLRKDFIIDEYQIHESFSYEADVILLISSFIGKKIHDFLSLANDLGLEAIVECHNSSEIDTAAKIGARLIGINNRDLKTMNVDIGTTKRLAKYVPKDRIIISESGIKNREDIKFVMDAGANAVLIGTTLMRSKDPKAKLRELLG
jgi:indole-3-glycerol phosphate synthase